MKIFKRAVVLFLILALSGSFLFAAGRQAGDDRVYQLTLGSAYDGQSPPFLAAVRFAEDVRERTNGRVVINTFSNSVLGTERDQFVAVAANELDFTVGGMLVIDMYCPEFGFLSAPYLFRDMAHTQRVMASHLGERMMQILVENNLNLIGLNWRGQRHTSSNRAIRSPADVRGLRIRMTEMPSWVAVWGADGLGGTTVPIVLGELYTALQTGVVEASEGPYEQLATFKFQEVQNYLINTGHVQEWCGIYASERMLQSLPIEYRRIVEERAAYWMTDFGSQLAEEMSGRFRQELLDGGMQEININVQDFTNAVMPVYERWFRERWTVSTMAEIQSFAR